MGTKKSAKKEASSQKKKSSMTASFQRAVRDSIAETKRRGNPVARYDSVKKQPYFELPDGTKSYVE